MWEAKGAASAERVSVQEGTVWQTVDAGRSARYELTRQTSVERGQQEGTMTD